MAQELTLWQAGGSRKAIEDFVARVTTERSPDFVPPEARIAVFDNDGTLWTEKPMPVELGFILERLAAMAEHDLALQAQQPFKAARERDYAWLGNVITKHYKGDDSDVKVLGSGILKAFSGMPVETYQADATAYLTGAPHPTLGRLLRECGYAPMVELLRYLEAHGFTNYIASGGDRDFMRVVTEEIYGIPAERVIGTSNALCYVEDEACGHVTYLAKPDVFDDGPVKPVRIWSRIGRRPILAAGNSNGDIQMLQFAGGDRPALRLLLLHDDAEREFAYTAGAETSLDLARARDWQIVSMKDEWKAMFAAPGRKASAAGAPGGA